MLSYLQFNRQALASYRLPRPGERIIDAEEELTARPVFLNYGCDLQLLEALRQRSYGFQKKPVVLCFDYQCQAMTSFLQDTAEVCAIDRADGGKES